jgi:hypothetical protein
MASQEGAAQNSDSPGRNCQKTYVADSAAKSVHRFGKRQLAIWRINDLENEPYETCSNFRCDSAGVGLVIRASCARRDLCCSASALDGGHSPRDGLGDKESDEQQAISDK